MEKLKTEQNQEMREQIAKLQSNLIEMKQLLQRKETTLSPESSPE